MLGAAWVADLTAQPAKGVFHQGNRLLPYRARLPLGRVIGLEQLHQRRRQLLDRPARPLRLEGMPVAVADGQQALQGDGLLGGTVRPVARAWRSNWLGHGS